MQGELVGGTAGEVGGGQLVEVVYVGVRVYGALEVALQVDLVHASPAHAPIVFEGGLVVAHGVRKGVGAGVLLQERDELAVAAYLEQVA